MSHQRRARLFTEALDYVEYSGREIGFFDNLRELPGGERTPLCWFENDCVAGGEGRSDPPGGEHQRCVPGRDDSADSYRHTHGVVEPLGVDWIRAAIHRFAGVVGVETEVLCRAGDLGADDSQYLACVQALDYRELVSVLFDQAGDLEKILPPVLGVQTPFREGLVRGSRGEVSVFGMASAGPGEHAVGGRVERLKHFSAHTLRPSAIDVMFNGRCAEFGADLFDERGVDSADRLSHDG